MPLRLKKVLLLSKKELTESLKNKDVVLVLSLMPLIFAVILPATIPIVNLSMPATSFEEEDLSSFPALVPYWDELNNKQQFLVFYTMMYFESFLLLPMILPLAIAADSIAGERERKTIEGLLASPMTSGEILLGKLMTTMIPSVIITWASGLVFMAIADISLYWQLGRLLYPNWLSVILLFGLSPFFSLITTQAMIIVSTKASGMREAQQIGGLIIMPLLLFLLGQTAVLIFFNPLWTLAMVALLLICTIILLMINIRLFDRDFMISNIQG